MKQEFFKKDIKKKRRNYNGKLFYLNGISYIKNYFHIIKLKI